MSLFITNFVTFTCLSESLIGLSWPLFSMFSDEANLFYQKTIFFIDHSRFNNFPHLNINLAHFIYLFIMSMVSTCLRYDTTPTGLNHRH
jgi:hypothetical protein